MRLAMIGLALLSAAAATPHLPVQLVGNAVMPDGVYDTLIQGWVDAGAVPHRVDAATASELAAKLRSFLLQSGYELAQVHGTVKNGSVLLHIDEGRLDKIIVQGQGALRVLQLKLELSIPHMVFNRPAILKQLRKLAKEYGLVSPSLELVPVRTVTHPGPQIESLGEIHGQPTIPPPGRYELRINFGHHPWDRGFNLSLSLGGADGLRLGASYMGGDLLFVDDRWRVEGKAAAAEFHGLGGVSPGVEMSRAILGASWFTPPLFGIGLRPFIAIKGDLQVRQRRDLALYHYAWLETDALAHLGYEPTDGFLLAFGLGGAFRQLFDIEQVAHPASIPTITDTNELRALGTLRADLLFTPQEIRVGRRHELSVEARTYFGGGRAPEAQLRWSYNKVFAFGWNDLFVRSHGAVLVGDVRFAEEEPIDDYVRGVFGRRYFSKRVGNLSLEFRYSVSRDLFKISAYTDLAPFEQTDPTGHIHRLRLATSTGIGFHALLLDIVDFDLYYGFGFSTDGRSDQGISARLVKAYY